MRGRILISDENRLQRELVQILAEKKFEDVTYVHAGTAPELKNALDKFLHNGDLSAVIAAFHRGIYQRIIHDALEQFPEVGERVPLILFADYLNQKVNDVPLEEAVRKALPGSNVALYQKPDYGAAIAKVAELCPQLVNQLTPT